jgi:SAM-dependent methyltransferase
MAKNPVDPDWFTQLQSIDYQRGKLNWLIPLRSSVESIADFGCWGSSGEPFALLWTLCASEIKVIELKQDYVDECKAEWSRLHKKLPHAFEGRSVEFITADMTEKVIQLEDDHFDLAFCERVLYQVAGSGLQEVQCAINEMTRVVKPGGLVVADESEPIRDRQGNPIRRERISEMFEKANLRWERCPPGAPNSAYCYRKHG